MESKDTKNKKEGMYLSNFVATAAIFFMLVLAFAAGFFAKNYFDGRPLTTAAGADTGKAVVPTQPKPATVTLAVIKDIFSKNVIKFGDVNSKVLFVEVSDPSCPFCSIAAGLNGELNKQVEKSDPTRYKFTLVKDGGAYIAPAEEMRKLTTEGKAALAYVYWPGHGNGEMGMKALYCAYDQGKFWQAYDLVMSGAGYDLLNNTVKNDKAKSDVLAAFLKDAVDTAALKSCLDSGKYDGRLQADMSIATSLGVNGTPGFFINEKKFSGAFNFTDMQSTVDAFLK